MKLTISQIEIINNGDGSPQVSILGQDGKNLSQSIKISISHTNDHAAAVAIAIHR
jgi:phosphopantetheinyl transferase (holo-ACP synthase)